MDDLLERPTYAAPPAAVENPEDAEQSSDEDDGGPDWTKLPSNTATRPVIPKRGEKEYEPSGDKGTDLQQYKLDRIRDAMFSALDVERTVSSKNISYAVWMPELARAHMTLARGNHLLSVGHSAPRDAWARENFESVSIRDKLAKRVELLPEETLYLIERGSMFCWKQADPAVPIEPGLEERLGSPMTVQQAYAEMIGKEDITLERYQVFAYLKRLGYVVTRARAPSKFYPVPPPYTLSVKSGQQTNILSKISEMFLWPFRAMFPKSIDWWKPLRPGTFLNRTLGYSSIFASLRVLPVGNSLPVFNSGKDTLAAPSSESPYTIFYNLYKPATPYRKTSPPPPDFQIVVIDGRTTPMPTMQELTSLFEQVPDLPPPVPRKRYTPPSAEKKTPSPAAVPTKSLSTPSQPPYSRILSWLSVFLFWRTPASVPQDQHQNRPYKPNPFQMLKAGKKIVVVAAVDAGMISFFRFGQGGFQEWPMA